MITVYLGQQPDPHSMGQLYFVTNVKRESYIPINVSVSDLLHCFTSESEDLVKMMQADLASGRHYAIVVPYRVYLKIMEADTKPAIEPVKPASRNGALDKVSQALRLLAEAVDELKERG